MKNARLTFPTTLAAEGSGPCGTEEWEAFRTGVEDQLKKTDGGDYAKAALKWIEESAKQ